MKKERMKSWYKHKVLIHNKSAWYNSSLKISHGSLCTLIHLCHACTNVSMCMSCARAWVCGCVHMHVRVCSRLRRRVCMLVSECVGKSVSARVCVYEGVRTSVHTCVFVHASACEGECDCVYTWIRLVCIHVLQLNKALLNFKSWKFHMT